MPISFDRPRLPGFARGPWSRVRISPVLAAGLVLIAPLAARGVSAGSREESQGLHDTRTTTDYSFGDKDSSFGWAVFDPADGSTTCNTGGDDVRSIQRIVQRERTPVLWFRLDDRSYVVRDPDLVARAGEIAAPVRELGRRQGELGAKQGRLGGRQAALGGRQAALAVRQAALSARLARLAALDRDDPASLDERRRIEQALSGLGDQQGALGAEQGPIGETQGELGRMQGELGREQARASRKATIELRDLAEQAIRDGKADRVRGRRAA
jgi:hypothetical protein